MKPAQFLAVNALLLTGLTVSTSPVSAALCDTEVLTPATETNIHVRQVIEQNVCTTATTPIFFPGGGCDFVEWTAATFQNIPNNGNPLPGVEVRFIYTFGDFCSEIINGRSEATVQISQAYLDAHPGGFLISSDQQVPTGDGVTWTITQVGTVPAMSFEGTVTSAGNGNVLVDVTFSSGVADEETTPAGAISDLIEFIGGASAIDGGVENALLASLEAALASVEAGNIEAAEGQLNALINKVEAVRSKKIFEEVADEIIAAANEILALL